MRFKIVLIASLILAILAIGAVSATDTLSEEIMSEDSNALEIEETNIYAAAETAGSFNDLENEINGSGNVLDIERDYIFNNGTDNPDGIFIREDNFVINGNGHIIDANNQSRIFVIAGNNITINNLTFINANSHSAGSVFNIHANCSLTTNNVILENNTADLGVIFVSGEYSSNNDKVTDSASSRYGVINVYTDAVAEFNNALMMSSKQLAWGFIYGLPNANIAVFNSTFANTTSKYSTAIYGSKSTVIKNSKFINLHAINTAGAIGLKGSENGEIDNCTFINVTSEKNAGAIFADVYKEGSFPPVLIKNSNFINSYSGFGGAIMQLGGTLTVDNSNFTNNSALFDGGAIYTSYGDVVISNSIFDGNHAQYDGGDRNTYGGTIFSDASGFNLMNCIIVNSHAGCGSAIYLYDADYCIENNTFSNNSDSEGNYNDIFTVFDGLTTILEGNTYSGIDTLSFNNTNYATIMTTTGMELFLINNTINVTTLPSAFDLREWGWVTPVRDQGSMGSCWTFGTAGAAESAILRFLGFEFDISENNMQDVSLQYYMYGTKGDFEGGTEMMGAAYALSWFGVFSSERDTYDELGKISPIIAGNDSIHFQDVVFIPSRKNVTDNNLLKEALIKYGALGIGYCAEQTAPYFNENTSAQYRNESAPTNHAVTLVGWNDTFSASNFLITPPGDGAWIFKNSWGETSGDHGYFYISYYDPTFVVEPAVGFVLENTVEYNKNYQYDIGGRLDFYPSNEYMNGFVAIDDDLIAGVGTYFSNSGVDYSVEIYVNEVLTLNQSGVSPFMGFHTIQLDSFIPIKEGDQFAVKIKSNATPILINSRQHYIEGSSQFLENGTWVNASEKNVVCSIKVYTVCDDTKVIDNQDVVVDYGSDSYFSVRVVTADGHAVGAGEKVNFTINGKTSTETTDDDGLAKIKITEDPGTYVMTTEYNGESYQNNVTVKSNLKLDVKLTVTNMDTTYKSGKYIIATLTDANGNPVSGVKVGFANNGVKYIETDASGKARYSTDHFGVGSYNVPVAFFGDDNYKASERMISKVTISKVATKLTVTNVDTTYKSGKYIIATLTDANGKPISGVKVGFANNGVKYIETDASGKARYSTDHFEEGSYNVRVAFFGDDNYEASERMISKVTISKVATKLTVTNVDTTYKSGENIVATLKDANGNPVSGVSVGFANNGVHYVTTDANGQANYSTNNFDVGSYNVPVAFFGNDMYKASDRETAIVVIKK